MSLRKSYRLLSHYFHIFLRRKLALYQGLLVHKMEIVKNKFEIINFLLKKTKYKIISIDNYSSGSKKNHIKNKRVKYIKADTKNISQIIKSPKNISFVFHFGEFARIHQSFTKNLSYHEIGIGFGQNFTSIKKILGFLERYEYVLVHIFHHY